MMPLHHETSTQFLARMILAVREGHQISRSDASRMSELAEFGPRGAPTMPEARKDVTKPLSEPKPEELIRT